MALVGGAGGHGHEEGDSLVRSLPIPALSWVMTLPPRLPAQRAMADPPRPHRRRQPHEFLARGMRGLGLEKMVKQLGPSASVAIGSRGQAKPASSAESDKNSFAHDNTKANLVSILSGQVPRTGYHKNAVGKSAKALVQDRLAPSRGNFIDQARALGGLGGHVVREATGGLGQLQVHAQLGA